MLPELSTAELDEAEALADRLLTALGEREHGPSETEQSARIRQQAFTLFLRAYEQAHGPNHQSPQVGPRPDHTESAHALGHPFLLRRR